MNIVFITLIKIDTIEQKNIYSDLIRFFIAKGHYVTVFSPLERREKKDDFIIKGDNYSIVRFKTFNMQKVGLVEKLIGTISIDFQLLKAVKKNLNLTNVDLLLYSTPPITISSAIKYIKNKFGATTYLLLKDIFPQNALDLELMSKFNPLYPFFAYKERKLYEYSDIIGCMSQANVDWIRKYHAYLADKTVEICPNSIELSPQNNNTNQRENARAKLNIQNNQHVFVFGGNLGRPQGIEFLLEVFNVYHTNKDILFIIVGSGTEYHKIETWINRNQITNVQLKPYAPKEEFDAIVAAADFGIISLNHKFKIPNFPSRLLSLMENKTPILSITDPNTDISTIIENNNMGVAITTNKLEDVVAKVNYLMQLSQAEKQLMGEKGYQYLVDNYQVEHAYNIIMKHITK